MRWFSIPLISLLTDSRRLPSEHFVEEYGTGFAGKNGRAGIGFCHGSLAQGFGTYGQAPYLVFQFGRSRQVFF